MCVRYLAERGDLFTLFTVISSTHMQNEIESIYGEHKFSKIIKGRQTSVAKQ